MFHCHGVTVLHCLSCRSDLFSESCASGAFASERLVEGRGEVKKFIRLVKCAAPSKDFAIRMVFENSKDSQWFLVLDFEWFRSFDIVACGPLDL